MTDRPFRTKSITSVLILRGDARHIPLADQSVHCCVTSPPYWGLRDYGVDGQLGLEKTPDEYIAKMVDVFREVKRVLRDDGTLWMNMGDCYNSATSADRQPSSNHAPNVFGKHGYWTNPLIKKRVFAVGLKAKDLVGMPWMLAFALRADGWYLRCDIIWSKPNPMPESVTDRPTKSHEYIFLLSKSEKYFYNQDAILEPVSPNTHARLSQNLAAQIGSHRANGGGKTNGPMKAVSRKARFGGNEKQNASYDQAVCLPVTERNKRSVWTVNTQSFSEAHFATFPEELIKPCILAGCPEGGIVLDPFLGSGTTALVARHNQCHAIGIELSEDYIEIAKRRLAQQVLF